MTGKNMTKKQNIPKAIREQCWLNTIGKNYESKCYVKWCQNKMTVFDFHVGHDIPESKGGTLDINNLKPICARCNLSMSDNYTIQEWVELSKPKKKWIKCC
jgi:5-methylcytosine-specific restriction endonuclease McrA